MKILLTIMSVTVYCNLMVALPGFAGQLDEHYLAAFGVQTVAQYGSAMQKAIMLPSPEAGEIPHCGTPVKHGLQRDWNKLEPATQKVLAKQLAAPVLSGAEDTLVSPSGRFRIHYTTSGADAVPSLAWVQLVAQTFDDVAAAYVSLGWRLAPTASASPYDVYLRNLASQNIYGQATSLQPMASPGFVNSYSSYVEIDNNFLDPIYQNALGAPLTPDQKALQNLQITATHEYHHAIQYGYNFFFDVWYGEATSTWFEDELYDGVNQLYNYIPNWFKNSTLSIDTAPSISTGGGYGRWIFNRYLAEQHGTGVIKAAWDKLATLNSPGGNSDIPMVPVLENLLLAAPFNSSLGAHFFGFAKRVYLRDWSSHAGDISRIHPYSPVAVFSSYPASSSSTLARYSFAFFRFTPSPTVPTLNINLSKTSGIRSALFTKTGNSTPTEFAANSDGSYTVSGFGSLNQVSDEVVLLVVNSTSVDNHQASFNSSGTAVPAVEPVLAVSAIPAAGGGGGGCFIATAAYGSYLHPQVQILRDFRDKTLLTNAPGRTFVALYYSISPPLADFIARHEMRRGAARVVLVPVIVAVAHPVLAGSTLLAMILLYFPIRRRFQTKVTMKRRL